MAGSAAEQAAVLALTKASPSAWYRTAMVISEAESAVAVLHGDLGLMPQEQAEYAHQLTSGCSRAMLSRAPRDHPRR